MHTLILADYNSINNSITYIQKCLRVLGSTLVPHILIIENGSGEFVLEALGQIYGSWETLSVPGIHQSVYRFVQEDRQIVYCHSGENLGYANGNNQGATIARELWADPYYIVSNNDLEFKNTTTGLAGGCHFTGIALCSSLTRQTRKYDLPTA